MQRKVVNKASQRGLEAQRTVGVSEWRASCREEWRAAGTASLTALAGAEYCEELLQLVQGSRVELDYVRLCNHGNVFCMTVIWGPRIGKKHHATCSQGGLFERKQRRKLRDSWEDNYNNLGVREWVQPRPKQWQDSGYLCEYILNILLID